MTPEREEALRLAREHDEQGIYLMPVRTSVLLSLAADLEAAERERHENWKALQAEGADRERAERALATAREALERIEQASNADAWYTLAEIARDALRSLDGEPTTQAAQEGR